MSVGGPLAGKTHDLGDFKWSVDLVFSLFLFLFLVFWPHSVVLRDWLLLTPCLGITPGRLREPYGILEIEPPSAPSLPIAMDPFPLVWFLFCFGPHPAVVKDDSWLCN